MGTVVWLRLGLGLVMPPLSLPKRSARGGAVTPQGREGGDQASGRLVWPFSGRLETACRIPMSGQQQQREPVLL